MTAPDPKVTYSQPPGGLLRWLADPGPRVGESIREALLFELFASPGAVIAGVMNVLALNIYALFLHGGRNFIWLLVADILISGLRIMAIRQVIVRWRKGGRTPTAFYLYTGIAWCGLAGGLSLFTMISGIAPLQILGAMTTMAIIGPVCARNYPAPRYAMLLVCLCDLQFVLGCVLSGNIWLLLAVLMTPAYIYGSHLIIARFQTMSIDLLQSRHESHLRARHDPLTGLLNRFGVMETLRADSVHAALRLTLFYLDLDGFKQINDGFGHLAGDALLRAVANRLQASVRGDDIAARMGGDEFVVLAPDMPPADAEAFARRLITVIQAPYEIPGFGTLRVGVSVGFACAPEDGGTLADLYRLADAALYEVKTNAKGTQRRTTMPAAA